jgi:hypothetical protein
VEFEGDAGGEFVGAAVEEVDGVVGRGGGGVCGGAVEDEEAGDWEGLAGRLLGGWGWGHLVLVWVLMVVCMKGRSRGLPSRLLGCLRWLHQISSVFAPGGLGRVLAAVAPNQGPVHLFAPVGLWLAEATTV